MKISINFDDLIFFCNCNLYFIKNIHLFSITVYSFQSVPDTKMNVSSASLILWISLSRYILILF